MDHCTSRGRNSTRTESVVYIGQKIGHCVKHIHREHHQEADHMAKWGAEGDMNVIVEGFRTMKAWQTIRGKWDGSKQHMWQQWMWHSDYSGGQGNVGHSQQQICTFEDVLLWRQK